MALGLLVGVGVVVGVGVGVGECRGLVVMKCFILILSVAGWVFEGL